MKKRRMKRQKYGLLLSELRKLSQEELQSEWVKWFKEYSGWKNNAGAELTCLRVMHRIEKVIEEIQK